MGGVSPETRWASYKYGIIKLIHCCILLDFSLQILLWGSLNYVTQCEASAHLHAPAMFLIKGQLYTEHTAVFMLHCDNHSNIFTKVTSVVKPAASKEMLL